MPPRALQGAWVKVERAQEHLQALREEISSFLQSEPRPYDFPLVQEMRGVECIEYPWRTLYNANALADAAELIPGHWFLGINRDTKYRVTVALRQAVPLLRWSVLAGDVIHELRCALDHLTWQLTLRHQRRQGVTPAGNPNKPWRAVQFPVSDQLTKPSPPRRGVHYWADQSHNCLWGIDQGSWARFEQFQPHRLKRSYKRHPLWVLNELWNTDKHRSINVAVGYANLRNIAMAPMEDDPASATLVADLTLEVLSVNRAGPLRDGVEIARVVVRQTTDPLAGGRPLHPILVQIIPAVRFQPSFPRAGPGRGMDMVQSLELVVSFVKLILNDFEVEFR